MLNQAEYFVKCNSKDVPEVQEAVIAIINYITKEGYYESKATRLEEWSCYEGDLFELVQNVFTACLQGVNTYQSLIGMFQGKLPMKDKWNRIQTIAEVIAVIGSTGLIRITKQGSGNSIMVDTEYALEGIPEPENHMIQFKGPKTLTENYSLEYGSVFLGSEFNHHKGNACLDYLNRMNAVELCLNLPFLKSVSEAPKKAIPMDEPEQQEQWDNFIKDSYSKYLEVSDRTFYQSHHYDARGRCYAEGFHINYQGSSFKKACVCLTNKEVVSK